MKNVINCHAIGLHSITVQENPFVRLFVTTEDHVLWENSRANTDRMSVGFHAHHCDITLTTVRGKPYNWLVSEVVSEDYRRWTNFLHVRKHRYRSALRGEKPGFDLIGTTRVTTLLFSHMSPCDPWEMKANQIHTVYVPKGERAAWLVAEGKEDPAYEPLTYSPHDLSDVAMDDLYLPMGPEVAQELLNWTFGQYDHLRNLRP